MTKALALLALGLALTSSALATTVYRTTDAQGNVIFTDSPDSGGEQVELKPLTVVPSRRREGASIRLEGTGPDTDPPAAGQPFMPYDTFRIISPGDEETLAIGDADAVPVELLVVPTLREDHRVRLLVDGVVSQTALHSTAFMLTRLTHGEHELQAELLDADGAVRHRTRPVRLLVQRDGG